MKDRVVKIANAFGMEATEKTRVEHVLISLLSNKRKWWLLGCVGGDCILPNTDNSKTAEEALDAAENWITMIQALE